MAHDKRALAAFGSLCVLAAAGVTAQKAPRAGQEWLYTGMVVSHTTGATSEHFVNDVRLSALVTSNDRNSVHTIRYRGAFLRPRTPGAPSPPPICQVWIPDSKTDEARRGSEDTMVDDLDMIDLLPIPFPYRNRLAPGSTLRSPSNVFRLQSQKGAFVLETHVLGTTTIGGRECRRIERKPVSTLPFAVGPMGGRLLAYTDRLWLDRKTSALVKYAGQAKLENIYGPNTSTHIQTSLELKEVCALSPTEVSSRGEQADVLSRSLPKAWTVLQPKAEDAARLHQQLEKMQTFPQYYPSSPYLAVALGQQQAIERALRVLERTKQQTSLVGQPAPTFTLKDLEGKAHGLAEFQGRILLLNFFASWCGPCNQEAPYIEKVIWQKLRDQGVSVIGVDIREEAKPMENARRFRDKHKLTYPILLDTADTLAGVFRVQAIPVNVLIDGDGVIRYIETGFNEAGLQQALQDALRRRESSQKEQ